MSKLTIVEPVDVASVCGYSQREFSQLYAGDKIRLAQLVYSTRIKTYELLDDIVPEDFEK